MILHVKTINSFQNWTFACRLIHKHHGWEYEVHGYFGAAGGEWVSTLLLHITNLFTFTPKTLVCVKCLYQLDVWVSAFSSNSPKPLLYFRLWFSFLKQQHVIKFLNVCRRFVYNVCNEPNGRWWKQRMVFKCFVCPTTFIIANSLRFLKQNFTSVKIIYNNPVWKHVTI